MTEIPISPEIWKLAAEILTQKQLTVLELREKHGYSWNQLAVTFNCTRANVREHHAAATRKIYDELERQREERANGHTAKEGHPPTPQPRPRSEWPPRDPAPARPGGSHPRPAVTE